MSKNEIVKEDDLLHIQVYPEAIYKEKYILEAFEEAINDIWQQGDASYHQTVSRKTNIKKFLIKLRSIRIKS